MRLEYLKEINKKGDSIIRLYNFSTEETTQLIESLKENIFEKRVEFNLGDEIFIKEVNCKLKLVIGAKNLGIRKISEERFECELSIDGYHDMINYLTPFLSNESGYQYLYNENVQIDFLYSKDGLW